MTFLIVLHANKHFYRLALLVFGLLLSWPTLAQPPGRILFNSDFEMPTLTPTSPSPPRQSCSPATACWYLVPESSVPGWNVVDINTTSTDVVNDLVEFWNSGFLGVPAQSGNQFIELNADRGTPVFFEICMFSGETLTWSLWHRGRSGIDQMFLAITDASNNVLSSRTISSGNTAWVNYTGTVTNTGPNGSVRFTFRPGTTASGDPTVGNFIDNIQVLGLNPLVEFAAPTYSAIENTVSRPRLLINGTIPVGGAIVTIGTAGGTATGGGTDYSFATTVNIPAGNYDGSPATSIPIGLTIVDDFLVETNETIIFNILGASIPLVVNDADCNGIIQSSTTYSVIDNDVSLLPVELIAFSGIARSNQIQLFWQTGMEKSSAHFEVLRSPDGLNWQSLGEVRAAGNSSVTQKYNFTTEVTFNQPYYLLKIVDQDGSYKYSKIIAVKTERENDSGTQTYPNPVTKGGKLHIMTATDAAQRIQIEIIDLLGVSWGKYQVANNQPTITIDAPTVVGTYLLFIFDGKTTTRHKVLVQ